MISVLHGVIGLLETNVPLINALSVPALLLTPVLETVTTVKEFCTMVKGPSTVQLIFVPLGGK